MKFWIPVLESFIMFFLEEMDSSEVVRPAAFTPDSAFKDFLMAEYSGSLCLHLVVTERGIYLFDY